MAGSFADGRSIKISQWAPKVVDIDVGVQYKLLAEHDFVVQAVTIPAGSVDYTVADATSTAALVYNGLVYAEAPIEAFVVQEQRFQSLGGVVEQLPELLQIVDQAIRPAWKVIQGVCDGPPDDAKIARAAKMIIDVGYKPIFDLIRAVDMTLENWSEILRVGSGPVPTAAFPLSIKGQQVFEARSTAATKMRLYGLYKTPVP